MPRSASLTLRGKFLHLSCLEYEPYEVIHKRNYRIAVVTAARYRDIDILCAVLCEQVAVLLREVVYHSVVGSACYHQDIR